jgi:hypothetical protein
MRVTTSKDSILARVGRFLARVARGPQFSCADCERWERCGLPPTETCLIKAAQLARGDWEPHRRYRALARTIGPM